MADRDAYDSLAPHFAVRINGAALPMDARADLIAADVAEDREALNMCTIVIKAWDGIEMRAKWIDDDLFSPGNPIEVDMGYAQYMVTLFDGEIVAVEPAFHEGGPPTLTVRAYDRGHRLMRDRRTRSYLDVTDSEIAARVASGAGLRPDVEDSAVRLPYVLQHNQTDSEFLRERAGRIGYEVLVEGRALCFRRRRIASAPDLTLRREVELLEFHPRLTTMGQVQTVQVQGWSARDKKEIFATGGAGDEGSLMEGTSTGPALTEKAFGHAANIVVDTPVHGLEEASQIARGGYFDMALGGVRARGTCIGEPALRAGRVVRVDGIGERFSGLYYVTTTEHSYTARHGYRTMFSAQRTTT